ncbi:MAG: DUF2779 domain-containing protein [Balneolaceae bacterium]|nr:DUF2779 domain-containing protein [Balneolaceae bacterium]
MTKGPEDFLINDHLFHQGLSCPLKIRHILRYHDLHSGKPVYRQRNKLNLRDAVALRFPNRKFTPDHLETALKKTGTWLNDEEVAICGAVLQSGNLITRIPILVKKGQELTIIQIHGKLRKQSQRSTIETAGKKRSTAVYLLKAAYRAEVVQRCFPGMAVEVQFVFPNKDFRSTVSGLNRVRDFGEISALEQPRFEDNLERLFSTVDATAGVSEVLNSVPESVAHPNFVNCSVSEVISSLLSEDEDLSNLENGVHKACKYCEYRKPSAEREGCWEIFFAPEAVSKPNKHVFELMGHGNTLESGNGVYYQEKVEITDGFHSFELMKKYGGPKITIQQRRNLQILSAKNETVPELWLKPGLKKLSELKFPLHFIDFEAATYALPLKRGVHPYEPVYFQFSCHSLDEGGQITHTEWLDIAPERPDPHLEFTEQLAGIPGILEGTLIQYSPFEKQGINNLIRDFRRNSMLYIKQIELLEEIRAGRGENGEFRFMDLNALLRDYYHNRFLDEGLGLKQILKSVLDWEKVYGNIEQQEIEKLSDPYLDIQSNGSKITDGSSAMNAWIAMKNGLLTPDEEEFIPKVLKKYCALDSYSMVLIYRHILDLLKKMEDEDLIF